MADEKRLREELAQHFEALRAEFERGGMSAETARRAARLKLGGEEQIRMLWRDARRGAWIEEWARDLRYAWRGLRHAPGYAAAVIVTLALAIAANVAMFSVAWAFLLRPLPYVQPHQLVAIDGQESACCSPVSYPLFLAWREHNHTFSGIAAWGGTDGALTGGGKPVHVNGLVVSANLFQLLGIRPAAGRFFLPGENRPGADAGNDAIVISAALFRRRFGGRVSALGRTLNLAGKEYTLVGVAPRGFVFLPGEVEDYWITTAIWAEPQAGRKSQVEARDHMFLQPIGRLRPDVTAAAAARDLDRVSALYRGRRGVSDVYPNAWVFGLHAAMVDPPADELHELWAAAAMVLLIACANLAGLGLARGLVRLPELRTRAALGARPHQLAATVLGEVVVLTAAGCALGVALAWPLVRVVSQQINSPGLNPAWGPPVWGYTAALAVAAAVLFGAWPAWVAARCGRGASCARQGRSVLVAAEIALALVLVGAAALLGRSLLQLARENPGFNPRQVLTARLTLPEAMPFARRPQVFGAFLDRVQTLPGVAAASASLEMPWSGNSWRISLQAAHPFGFEWSAITPEYFQALRIPVLQGRAFTASDGAGAAPVVVINQAFARKLRPKAADPASAALGMAIRPNFGKGSPRTIVGVVANVVTPGERPKRCLYLPYAQVPEASSLFVEIRAARGDPMALAPAVRQSLAQVSPELALGSVQPLAAYRDRWASQPQGAAAMAGAFGILALLLAAIGLYGLMAYAVRQRQRELAVRVALGAQPGDLYRLVLGGAARLTGFGLLTGGAGLFLLRPALASQLYNLSPLDPASLIAAALLLASVALAAAWFPARHAARADPMRVLRTE
ncbi:MAG: ADOP family duplicated permease [Terriglobales bacterium]